MAPRAAAPQPGEPSDAQARPPRSSSAAVDLDAIARSGITAAFDTFVTATSIAYGLMVSAVILPGRFGVGGSAP